MAEKIWYSDQTPKEEQPPVTQTSDKTAGGPVNDLEQADGNRRALEEKAKAGLKNAAGQLPRDQI